LTRVALHSPEKKARKLDLARVLLVDGDLASRLTLKTLLQAGGYAVDGAASAAEAVNKLDANEYHLVLSDLRTESPEAGPSVLAYAREKEYRPATALITSYLKAERSPEPENPDQQVVVNTEDVSNFLGRVADLIGVRTTRRINRNLRHFAAG
jgi:CheY-like chemotaxis protein